MKKYEPLVKMIFDELKASIHNLSLIKIYGEYYGGVYPEVQGKNKAIQKTIFYTPELEFEAFDLFF